MAELDTTTTGDPVPLSGFPDLTLRLSHNAACVIVAALLHFEEALEDERPANRGEERLKTALSTMLSGLLAQFCEHGVSDDVAEECALRLAKRFQS